MHRTLLSDFTGPLISLSAAAERRRPARARTGFAAIRRRWLSPQRLLIACLVAVVAAAVLVVYLERRAAALQRVRTDMVVRQVCERTAAALATRTRELFGAGVLATIEAIGHREIEQYHLARIDDVLVGRCAVARLRRPLLLLARADAVPLRSPAPVLPPARRGWRQGRAGRRREPAARSMRIRDAARRCGRPVARLGALAQSFAVEEVRLDGKPYQAVFHFMWSNPQRSATFSIVGYLVDLDDLRADRFARIVAHGLAPLLNPGAELPRLALRVEDAAGPPDHRPRSRQLRAAVGVRALRPAVLPQPRAGQLPGAAAGGGELAADRAARGAAAGRLAVGSVAARRGGRPAADRGRVRRRRQPRGDPPVAAAVRLRAERVAPAADAAGDAVRRGRDARPRARSARPRRSSTTPTSCRPRPGACRRWSTRSCTCTRPITPRPRCPGSASISARWWRGRPATCSCSPIGATWPSRSDRRRRRRARSTATRWRSNTSSSTCSRTP